MPDWRKESTNLVIDVLAVQFWDHLTCKTVSDCDKNSLSRDIFPLNFDFSFDFLSNCLRFVNDILFKFFNLLVDHLSVLFVCSEFLGSVVYSLPDPIPQGFKFLLILVSEILQFVILEVIFIKVIWLGYVELDDDGFFFYFCSNTSNVLEVLRKYFLKPFLSHLRRQVLEHQAEVRCTLGSVVWLYFYFPFLVAHEHEVTGEDDCHGDSKPGLNDIWCFVESCWIDLFGTLRNGCQTANYVKFAWLAWSLDIGVERVPGIDDGHNEHQVDGVFDHHKVQIGGLTQTRNLIKVRASWYRLALLPETAAHT